ncbi:MAG TPA: hypothetical protein VGI90_09860 [Steroidobacteraceae bacterium]|jgi:hypothetical protein
MLCFPTHLTSSDLAAWVQAIVSAAAIIAAFIGIFLQGKWARQEAAKARHLERKSRLESVLAVAEAALSHVNNFDTAFAATNRLELSGKLYSVYHPRVVDTIVESLTAIPTYLIGSRDAVLALLRLRDQFRFLGESIIDYQSGIVSMAELTKAAEMYPNPAERKQAREVADTTWKVLVGNVRNQLGHVRGIYVSLSDAINRDIASD